jgi:hypothetical protein
VRVRRLKFPITGKNTANRNARRLSPNPSFSQHFGLLGRKNAVERNWNWEISGGKPGKQTPSIPIYDFDLTSVGAGTVLAKRDAPIGEYVIDLDQLRPYEAAALVLTLLAEVPAEQPGTSLDQRYGEICAYVIHRLAQMKEGWSEEHHLLRPMHALIPIERALAAGNRLATALEHRLIAGRMAFAFIDKQMLGQAARLPPGVKRLSQNEMARFIAAESQTATEANIKNRSFYPSLPVIHLSAALAGLRVLLALPEEKASLVDRLIEDMDVLKALVLTAQALEAPALASDKLGVTESTIVRIRWAGE